MADIALVTADRVSLVEDLGQQRTLPAGVAITAGAPVYLGAAGKWLPSDGNGAGIIASVEGLAVRTVVANEGLTVIEKGTMDGWDLSGLAYGAIVYLSDNIGRLADAPGTTKIQVATVVPGTAVPNGTAYDKLLKVDPQFFDALV